MGMTPYQTRYQTILKTPQQAAQSVNSGDTIVYGMSIIQPPALLRAFAERIRAENLQEIQMYTFLPREHSAGTVLDPAPLLVFSSCRSDDDKIRAQLKSILAFYSTAKSGKISKIVPRLESGVAVTTPRADVHLLATGYGMVNLKGRSTKERALEIISIAHPSFRDSLMDAADSMGII